MLLQGNGQLQRQNTCHRTARLQSCFSTENRFENILIDFDQRVVNFER